LLTLLVLPVRLVLLVMGHRQSDWFLETPEDSGSILLYLVSANPLRI
jgi:hypothetical protein